MIDVRANLTPEGIRRLEKDLDARVAAIGLPGRSDLIAKILELNEGRSAGFVDYSRVIRTDAGLAGRLLKTVNSAFYAQRAPVTNLDRACVLLGLERLKAFSLGYSLSQATADPADAHSRAIWGESVFRGCLASELAREVCPIATIEAFVVGLMMDAGIGLMPKLIGDPYRAIQEAALPPAELFEQEFTRLPFTHVDLVRAFMRQWRLPPLLAGPIERHHAAPDDSEPASNESKLHRVAYVVGQTDCRPTLSPEEAPPVMPSRVSAILGISQDRIANAISRATTEYRAAIDLFAGVAAKIPSPDALAARVRRQLTHTIEEMLENGGGCPPTVIERFLRGDTLLEVRQLGAGSWIAYLCDEQGGYLAQVTFQLRHANVRSIRESLGLAADEDVLIQQVLDRLQKKAA